MINVLCIVGRHLWTRHTSPDVGGAAAAYSVCGRCGKEKQEYDGRAQGPGGIVLGG